MTACKVRQGSGFSSIFNYSAEPRSFLLQDQDNDHAHDDQDDNHDDHDDNHDN